MRENTKKLVTESSNDFDYSVNTTEVEERADELRKMHETIIHMNNEDAYFGDWITFGPPDGATEDDFMDIAEDKEFFNDIKRLFKHIYSQYHDDGLYNATKEVMEFARSKDKEYGLEPIQDMAIASSMVKDLESSEEVTEQLEDSGNDGWGDEVESILSPAFDKFDKVAYEIRNTVRGAYTGAKTVSELVDYINTELLEPLEDAVNQLDQDAEELTEDVTVPNAASYDTDQAKGLDELSYLLSTEYEAVKWYDEAVDKIKESGLNQNIIAEVLRGIEDIRKDEEDHIAHLEKLSNLVKEKGAEGLTESLEGNDGWSEDVKSVLENVLDDIYDLNYELDSTVRGAYTRCENAADLADYVSDLADRLQSCSEELRNNSEELDEALEDDESFEDKHSNEPRKIMTYI